MQLVCQILGSSASNAFVLNLSTHENRISHIRAKIAALMMRSYEDVSVFRVNDATLRLNDPRISPAAVERALQASRADADATLPQSLVACTLLENPLAKVLREFPTLATVLTDDEERIHILVCIESPKSDDLNRTLASFDGSSPDENDFLVLPGFSFLNPQDTVDPSHVQASASF
ncbi:hypothetical protein HDU67_005694 [Dinochytrium kinnereticum]|nr:hypothetical protein HDU67_005694 [Dinochytrium kinnereticum]